VCICVVAGPEGEMSRYAPERPCSGGPAYNIPMLIGGVTSILYAPKCLRPGLFEGLWGKKKFVLDVPSRRLNSSVQRLGGEDA